MQHAARLALTLVAVACFGRIAGAQGVNIPPPGAVTYTYNDADGTGRLTVTREGPDSVTSAQIISVTLVQNGVRYQGSGVTYPLSRNSPTNLIAFVLVGPDGRSYFYQANEYTGLRFRAQGTYFPVTFASNVSQWSIQ
jgi:hypothetical protein